MDAEVELERAIRRKVSQEFLDFRVLDESLARLESRNAARDRFYIYYQLLTEDEIAEMVRIVSEVYGTFLDSDFVRMFVSDTKQELNIPTEYSAEFVRTVISLDGTALHKFLLLTSGKHILRDSNLDVLIHLAKTKNGNYSLPKIQKSYRPFCNYSENLYILPGITDKTVMINTSEAEDNLLGEQYFESALSLIAFIAEGSETLTLSEWQKRDFIESITTKKHLTNLVDFNESINILMSPIYASLAKSMTARELRSLAMILGKQAYLSNLPYEFLRNRAEAMAARRNCVEVIDLKHITGYLSDEEMLTGVSQRFLDELEVQMMLIQVRGNFMSAAWAAFAELFAVKGPAKTLEVANVIGRDVNSSLYSVRLYQSIVMLILEALKPEADDYPFSWFAQLSEHAWVLSPNLLKEMIA